MPHYVYCSLLTSEDLQSDPIISFLALFLKQKVLNEIVTTNMLFWGGPIIYDFFFVKRNFFIEEG